ncbi:hypothetical protein V8D89_000749 [Ganoderma adspersum]
MLSLPNELIALILLHLSEGPEIDDSSWPLRSSSHGWLPFAQTFRRVHDVAVSTQHLWQRLAVFSKNGGLNTALSRSGDLEIDVIFHRPHIIPSGFMLLAPHAARMRMLVIVEADHNTHSALRFLLARPMPALTTCQIHLVHRYIHQPRPDGMMRFTVDSTLVPNLRTLQLGVLSLDWRSEAVSRLHRLSLWSAAPQVLVTFDRFLDILESCTALEHLEIRHIPQFALPDDASDWQRVVALPHLHTLILESSYYLEVSLLLSHLQLSEHVDVDIALDIDTDFEDDAFLALPDILTTDPTRLPLLALATSASFASCGFISVECSAPAHGPGRLRVFLNPGSAEEIDEGWHYPPTQAVAHFCALLEHAPLRALELQLAWPYAGETCAAGGMFAFVFSTFPGLEELAYGGGANEASDRQLVDVLAGDVLPRLRVLRLGEWSGELVSLLVDVLQGRTAGGLRLSQLHVRVVAEGESVAGAALHELQGLVDGDVNVR